MIASKRFLSSLTFLIVSACFTFAGGLSEFIQNKGIDSINTAVLIKDLKTGKIITSHNASKPLIPASIMKSVTIATLLDKIGHDYVYVTPVYMSGSLQDGVLNGNLVVVASGDPSINSRFEPKSPDFISEIVDALKNLNIHTVNGSVIIDEGSFPGPSVNPNWGRGDLPHRYGTGTHGFNFEDNAKGDSSVANPGEVFKSKLTAAAAKSGISIGNSVVENSNSKGRKLLVQHSSAPIDEIMRSCMMRSDNQFAEAFLRLAGLKYGKEGSTSEGARLERSFWESKRADLDSVIITDGSGLSRSNRVTANFMTDMLSRMYGNPYYASFFPLAGQEGTLRRLLASTPLEGYVAMKTGSMTGIQCYAGYKLDDDYEPTHVIVIIMNNLKNRDTAKKGVEKMLLDYFAN